MSIFHPPQSSGLYKIIIKYKFSSRFYSLYLFTLNISLIFDTYFFFFLSNILYNINTENHREIERRSVIRMLKYKMGGFGWPPHDTWRLHTELNIPVSTRTDSGARCSRRRDGVWRLIDESWRESRRTRADHPERVKSESDRARPGASERG